MEISPRNSCHKRGGFTKTQHPFRVGVLHFFLLFFFLQFFLPLPVPSLPLLLSSSPSPLPRHWGGEVKLCSCCFPFPIAPLCQGLPFCLPEHPLPEVMQIRGAGAVLVLAEVSPRMVPKDKLLGTRCWSALGFAGCFCTFWAVGRPSFQGPWQGQE